MIKANELRIGNLVLNKHNEPHEIGYNCFSKFRTPSMDGDPSGFKPIPLTEEWLLKAGFICVEDWWYNYVKSPIVFSWNIYDRTLRCVGYPFTHIQYVHQLQNLFYSLCGEELTFDK